MEEIEHFLLFISATFAKKAGYWVIWKVAYLARKPSWALNSLSVAPFSTRIESPYLI